MKLNLRKRHSLWNRQKCIWNLENQKFFSFYRNIFGFFTFFLFQPLKLIAAPTREGHFDDTLVCCIRENPEPITYKISCDGCTPELFVEPTSFDFGQVLLYRYVFSGDDHSQSWDLINVHTGIRFLLNDQLGVWPTVKSSIWALRKPIFVEAAWSLNIFKFFNMLIVHSEW